MNAEALELSRRFGEITRERPLREIVDAIIDAAQVDESGELTDEANAALDSLNLTLSQKVEAYHVVCNELTEAAAGCKSLAAYYEARQARYLARAKRLQERLLEEMERLGTSEVKAGTVRACVQESPPAVVVRDGVSIDAIDPEFVVVKRDVNKGALLRAMKAGREFAYATLRRGTHLRWR